MGVKIKERPPGSGVWWLYIDHNGIRKAKKIGKDKRIATAAAKKIEAKLALGDLGFLEPEEKKTPTLSQYIDGWEDGSYFNPGWFNKVAKLSLKNSTRKGYRQVIDCYLIPTFGAVHLEELTPRIIFDYIYKLIADKGLRSGTVRNVKNCLSAILRHASSQDGFIETNPAHGVTVPRPEDERPSREPDPFTWEEREYLEMAFKEHFPRYYPMVVCGFRTGLRIGEIIGLGWGDIDFYNRLILIKTNITRGKITTPKSKSSARAVRMTSQLVDILKKQKKAVKEEKLKKGWPEVPEWVFCNEEGGFLSYPNFIHRVWNRAMELSGLRRRTPHDMRHTYATLRLSKGDSLAEVSKEMGHATTSITYSTYYKWLPKESRSNIDELDGGWEAEDATGRNLSATQNE